jgi:putative SOS response-associated peptidase YedK
MCGRYSVAPAGSAAQIADVFGAIQRVELTARYNVAPSQDAPIVRIDERGELELVMLRWGLVPWWAQDIKVAFTNINARAESIATKPAFRDAFRYKRCLVIATGFYEWQKTGSKTKQPYNVRPTDADVFAMAGLWERWRSPANERVETFCIITTNAAPTIETIHDRMPVILPPSTWRLWLDPDASSDRLSALLRPYPAELLVAHKVDARVGSPANDDPSCVAPLIGSG